MQLVYDSNIIDIIDINLNHIMIVINVNIRNETYNKLLYFIFFDKNEKKLIKNKNNFIIEGNYGNKSIKLIKNNIFVMNFSDYKLYFFQILENLDVIKLHQYIAADNYIDTVIAENINEIDIDIDIDKNYIDEIVNNKELMNKILALKYKIIRCPHCHLIPKINLKTFHFKCENNFCRLNNISDLSLNPNPYLFDIPVFECYFCKYTKK